MEAVELAGLDVAANDAVELLASDPSTARALFEGVPAARLLARARAGRDERDLLVADTSSQPSFTYDAIVANVCGVTQSVARVRAAVARQARAASVEGPLDADDATIATLVFAVAITPAPDASMAEAFVESTTKGLQVTAMMEIAQSIEALRQGVTAYDARLMMPDPRGALFEACLRLAASARFGPVPAARLLEASRRLQRAGFVLLKPGPTVFPPSIDAELPRRARRMAALDRATLEAIAKRDPRELATALARVEPGAAPSSLRLDTLLADVAELVNHSGALVVAVASNVPEPAVQTSSSRPSWLPHEWGTPQAAITLAMALERGNATVPRAFALVQRGGDTALDAIGAEMLNVETHPFASAAFAEILARGERARDVTRLITYFAIAPDPTLAARALSACGAPELPSMLRSWLESMLPQDGSSVPLRSEPTSSSARLSAYVEALRPHKTLFDAVRPLLERIAPKK
ncbi:MAG TPA: hypothetical protein VGH28_07820 [Polyangiaceae bacterium]|jgi:hypothetical protein